MIAHAMIRPARRPPTSATSRCSKCSFGLALLSPRCKEPLGACFLCFRSAMWSQPQYMPSAPKSYDSQNGNLIQVSTQCPANSIGCAITYCVASSLSTLSSQGSSISSGCLRSTARSEQIHPGLCAATQRVPADRVRHPPECPLRTAWSVQDACRPAVQPLLTFGLYLPSREGQCQRLTVW